MQEISVGTNTKSPSFIRRNQFKCLTALLNGRNALIWGKSWWKCFVCICAAVSYIGLWELEMWLM